VATHKEGAALIRGEWKAAANLILQPRDGDILHYFIQKMKIVLLEDWGVNLPFLVPPL
jgi:tRNA(Glu) U13 pseudouridine synthase TruD